MTGGLNMESEKRRFTRFPLKMNATLAANNHSYNVDNISNLSIGGCFLPIHADLAKDTPCTLTIYLGAPEGDLTVRTEGVVIRCEHGGVGIQFISVDPESLFHLQMLARYNSPDTERIEEEIKKHPGTV